VVHIFAVEELMDFFRRFYNIVRAEIPTGSADGGDRTDKNWEDTYNPTRDAQGKSRDQDPVLAGYYANLELPYGADIESVKKSWKRLMKQYHPDMHSRDASKKKVADELCAELTRAYQELERVLAAQT
jgi:DnaJ-domain-containing protein 1